MKGIFVILDGVSDEQCSPLGDKTPLEYAKTPNLDYFASHGMIGHCFPIAEGVAPQSSSGIISLFGKDFRDMSRGLLEAMGTGAFLHEGDLVFRCNLATVEGMNLIDRRAGRTLTDKEAKELVLAVNKKVKLPFAFELIHTVGHRAILILRGNFSPNISNVDPGYEDGLSVPNSSHHISLSQPLDDSPKSKLAADLVNAFVRKSAVILETHPVNEVRERKGLYPANFILCRDPGRAPLRTHTLPGIWKGFGYMPLEKGIAHALGMRLHSFSAPTLDNIDSYAHLEKTLKLAIKNSIDMLLDYSETVDYFYIHFKETDIPGHDNKPRDKVKFIEIIDKEFFGFLKKFLKEGVRLLVTADHTTSCRMKSHTAHPVPLLYYTGGESSGNARFVEKDGLLGKNFIGRDLLKKTLLS